MQLAKPLLSGATIALLLFTALPGTTAHHATTGTFTEPVWFQWNRLTIDILIVPPAVGQVFNANGVLGGFDTDETGPCTNSYTRAIQDGIDDINDGIQQFGAAWLKGNLSITHRTLGCNTTVIGNPQILVISDPDKATMLGVSTRPAATCISDVSMAFLQSFTYSDMFSVSSHEIVHCLGADHVVDDHPTDKMDAFYAYSPGANNPLLCMSNLNVKTLEGAFAAAAGVAGAGVAGSVATGSYATTSC